MHHNIDYIIAGGGLAGSLLAFELVDRGADLLLIDTHLAGAASPIAAGIANPVTGRRLVLEPEFREKQAALKSFALKLEQLGGRKLLTELPQTRYLNTLQSQQLPKLNALPEFQRFKIEKSLPHARHENSLCISNTFRLDIPASCQLIHNILDSKKSRIETKLNYDELDIGNGYVRWREFQSKKIIFCEGWRGIHNPWFSSLPFNLNKGQLLKLSQPNSQPNFTNWGQWELHTGTERWLGATTERNYQLLDPDAAGRSMLLESLAIARERHAQNLPLIQEAQIIQQYAGVRPATIDRKPFIGLHPSFPQLGIFNGFGGKGSLHIPHAALALVDQLIFTRNSHNQARLDQLLSD
jgi:glycine oxidase